MCNYQSGYNGLQMMLQLEQLIKSQPLILPACNPTFSNQSSPLFGIEWEQIRRLLEPHQRDSINKHRITPKSDFTFFADAQDRPFHSPSSNTKYILLLLCVGK